MRAYRTVYVCPKAFVNLMNCRSLTVVHSLEITYKGFAINS